MIRQSARVLLVLAGCAVALAARSIDAAAPQGQRAPQPEPGVTQVALGSGKGGAEGILAAPIDLAVGEGTDVGFLSITIRFPAAMLSFLRADRSGLAEGVGAEATTALKTDKEDAVLEVTIAAPEKDGARPPLPEGTLVDLWFKIAKDAKPASVIPLTIASATARAATGDAPVKIARRDGQIVVNKPIITSCMFYMH